VLSGGFEFIAAVFMIPTYFSIDAHRNLAFISTCYDG